MTHRMKSLNRIVQNQKKLMSQIKTISQSDKIKAQLKKTNK